MANPITLEPIKQPIHSRTDITADQLNALITAIASANPAVLVLPEGVDYSDVESFNLRVNRFDSRVPELSGRAGSLDVSFK